MAPSKQAICIDIGHTARCHIEAAATTGAARGCGGQDAELRDKCSASCLYDSTLAPTSHMYGNMAKGTCGAAGRVQARTLVILLRRSVHSLFLVLGCMGRPNLIVSAVHVMPMYGMVPIACMRHMRCMVSIATVCPSMCIFGSCRPLAPLGLTAIAT